MFLFHMYIYLTPDKYLGYSKTDLFFLLLVRSRGAPPVHVYPPRRTLSAAPWTYMSGGRFLTSSQFFGSLDPFRCRTFNIYYTYSTWYDLFLNLPLELLLLW